MALWLAICITLLATTGNSIGKALQKHGTKGLPKFSFETKVVLSYLRCTEWVVGILADLLGGVLMISAYALAPVGHSCMCHATTHTFIHAGVHRPACVGHGTRGARHLFAFLPQSVCCECDVQG